MRRCCWPSSSPSYSSSSKLVTIIPVIPSIVRIQRDQEGWGKREEGGDNARLGWRSNSLSFSGSYHVGVDIWISFTSGEGGSSTELDRSRGKVDPSGSMTFELCPVFPTTLLHTPSPPTCVSGCCWMCGREETGSVGVGWIESPANPRSRFRLSKPRNRFVALPFELELWFGGEACPTLCAFTPIPPYTAPTTPKPPPPPPPPPLPHPLLPSETKSSGCFRLRVCENHG